MRCDCHVHIVGPAEQYPLVSKRTYKPAIAPLDVLRNAAAVREVRRFVIVQPSFYGTDNRATLEACDALGGNGRAVAVIDPQTCDPSMLKDFHRRGVRGLRINLYSSLGGGRTLHDTFNAVARVAKEMDWHVQVIASLKMLGESASLLAGSPVPVVVDHYGLPISTAPESEDGRILLGLMALPHMWVKLSAPYRNSADPLAVKPDRAWLRALLSVAESRCVWGSDWPHTPAHDTHRGPDIEIANRPFDYAVLVDEFADAVGSKELLDRVMQENPAKLYGF